MCYNIPLNFLPVTYILALLLCSLLYEFPTLSRFRGWNYALTVLKGPLLVFDYLLFWVRLIIHAIFLLKRNMLPVISCHLFKVCFKPLT